MPLPGIGLRDVQAQPGMRRARYTGHARVSAQIHLTMAVYNLVRMLKPTRKPARA